MNHVTLVYYTIRTHRTGGFTLIEVLISLAILTIILGAAYSSFFTVQRALERYDTVSLKYHETRTALDLMRREIEGAFLKNPGGPGFGKNQAAFVIEDRDIFGEPTSRLHLTAFSFRGSGLTTLSYYVQENNGSLTLVKDDSPAFRPLTDTVQANTLSGTAYTLEMIEDIEGFTVEILFRNEWVRTWDTKQTGRLPDIVRFSIEFNDNGKQVKLTEYARPRIGKTL